MVLEGLRWVRAERGLGRDLREWWGPFERNFGVCRRLVERLYHFILLGRELVSLLSIRRVRPRVC